MYHTMMLPEKAARRGYFMLKKVNPAIREYDMIRDGDRVAVAVSGGKDSLSLLTLLRLRQQRVPQRYELVALHVRGDARGPGCPAHPPLTEWLQAHAYAFSIESLELSPDEPQPLSCQRCARNRRKTIFQAADRLGCNVVAFAHHGDDLAQTALLNLFYGGRLETMAPSADYFGRFRLIRPLAFVAEKDVAYFSRACEFPPPPPKCPRAGDSHRALAAEAMRLFRHDAHRVRTNLIRASLRQPGPLPDQDPCTPVRDRAG
jgi:tRNA 2-thiocytidine biosynthesis protein TtcA